MTGHRRGVQDLGAGPEDLHPMLGRVQRAGVDPLGVRIAALDKVEEAFSVWKKLWIAVPAFPAGSIRLGQKHGDAAGGRNAAQSIRRSKNNDAVTAPCAANRAATSYRSVAHHQRTPAGDVNPLQFATGEECDRLAVWRPEREIGAFRAGKGAGGD